MNFVKRALTITFAVSLISLSSFAQTADNSIGSVIDDIKKKGKSAYQELLEEKRIAVKEKEEEDIFEFLKKQYQKKIDGTKEIFDIRITQSKLLFDSLRSESSSISGLFGEVSHDKSTVLSKYVELKIKETQSKLDSLPILEAKESSYISYGMKPERETVIKELVQEYDDWTSKVTGIDALSFVMSEYNIEFKQITTLLEYEKERNDKIRAEIEAIRGSENASGGHENDSTGSHSHSANKTKKKKVKKKK